MSTIPTSTVVRVNISTTPNAPTQRGFGIPLLVTQTDGSNDAFPRSQGVKKYFSLSEIEDDYTVNSEVYKSALDYFSISPSPTQFNVGYRYTLDQNACIQGGGLPEEDLPTWQAITDGSFTISIDGDSQDITGLDFSTVTDLDDVASVFEGALQTIGTGGYATATFTNDGTTFLLKTGTFGASATVSFMTTFATGTDVSSLVKMKQGEGQRIDGIDAETNVQSALDRLEDCSDWYCLLFTKETRDNQDVKDAAAWIEAHKKQFFTVTNDETAKNGAFTTDIASYLNGLNTRRTWVQYSEHPEEYPDASAFGEAAIVDFEGIETTKTLKFKQQPNITPENISVGELATLTSKGANVYINIGGVPMISEGIMSAGVGTYQDAVHGVDWLEADMELRAFTYLYTRQTKVPLTDKGAQRVVDQVKLSLDQGVRNDLIAPGTTTEGEFLPLGYKVTVGKVADMTLQDKQARKCPPIYFTAIGASAIHSMQIDGLFEG